MKKITLLFLATAIIFSSCAPGDKSKQPCWNAVAGAASASTEFPDFGTYNSQYFVAGYYENAADSYIILRKLVGSAWTTVDTYAIADTNKPWQVRMKIDQANGDIYIAYEKAVSHKVGVLKYSGAIWTLLGGAELDNVAENMDIALDTAGIVHLVTTVTSGTSYAQVSKYNGSWTAVGSLFGGTGTDHPRICVDSSSNTIYVSVIKNDLADTIRDAEVYSYNETTNPAWTLLGGASAATQAALMQKPIYADATGVYLSYTGNSDNLIYVRWFTGGAWSGTGGALNSNAVSAPAELDGKNGTVYAFYGDTDGILVGEGTVRVFKGSAWSLLCSAGFTGVIIHNTHNIYVDKDSGAVFTAYTSTTDYAAYIMKH
jgi:hypothetical protein